MGSSSKLDVREDQNINDKGKLKGRCRGKSY